MRIDVLDPRDDRRIELRTFVDTEELDALNAEARRRNPSGWTRGRGFRHIANIDGDFLNGLIAIRDRDAVDWELSGGQDTRALHRLLSRWPEMCVADRGI